MWIHSSVSSTTTTRKGDLLSSKLYPHSLPLFVSKRAIAVFNSIGARRSGATFSVQQQRYSSSKPHIIHMHTPTYTGGTPVFCFHSFQLATPPGFQLNCIPKGNLVLHCRRRGPSIVLVSYAPGNNTGTVVATAATPHTATLVNPICAKRFHKHYSGQPAP